LLKLGTPSFWDGTPHIKSSYQELQSFGDLGDGGSIDTIIQEIKPDYFINFAAQSFVGISWKIPEETFMAGAVGVLKCLEAIRKYQPLCRFYNAGSSEQFGDVIYSPQDEKHPFRPRSPYGAAKASAHFLVKVYRESYNLYAIQGLLFNHESERRGPEFVTRKITQGVARIKEALDNKQSFEPLELGNLDTRRDWSHAEDFIDGVWRMLNQEKFNKDLHWIGEFDGIQTMYYDLAKNIKEYVLASGETHTIREFVELAFKHAGIEGSWINGHVLCGSAPYDPQKDVFAQVQPNGRYLILVRVNPKFYRPNEVELLLGNSSAAQKDLGWKPKISLDELAKRMVSSDINERANQKRA
jgi:GDPmannose 4,6-dehydratase